MRLDDLELRVLAYKRGLTQKAIAEQIGRSRCVVANIFRGVSCSEATAQLIADALGVDLDTIKAKD